MKKLLLIMLCSCCSFLFTAAQNITTAEYFIDTDPGNGNGITLSVGASGTTVNFVATVPLGSLSAGFHFVAIRTKDADGKWGLFESRGFYILTAITNAANITAAEYFIDTDPGNGNGTALSVGTSGTTVNFVAPIPTTSLATGFHFVAIRTRDTDGKWGLFENRGFYISGQTTNTADIVAAEYYYDTDPGVGNGIAISIPAATSNYTDSLLLPLGSLPMGNHRIAIRVKNADGQWSLLENKLFNICTRYGPLSRMDFHVENNQAFFTNISTDNDSTQWKFGDATTDTVLNPIKTYAAAGNYNLQLISKNICANDTLFQVIPITGIHRINANKGGNNGVATVIFDGNGFTAATVLKLQKGATILLPTDKQFISSYRVIGYFNLTGADTGRYNVVANLGGGPLDTLKNGFTVSVGRYPNISIIEGGRNPARLGFMIRTGRLQNRGNEDAVMLPFATVVGYKPGTIALSSMESFVNLTNKGIFQNTFQYLNANSISTDVMEALDVDTTRKKQLLAYYRVKVPAESYVTNYYRINNSFGLLAYDNRSLVHPPLYKSTLVLNDVSAPNARDCMNSFLKKAVKRNISVTISDAAWNSCFNTAFDTLSKTIRDIVKDISLQEKSIPMKSVYATLLVQMTQCGSSGMPASLTTIQFEKIIKDVTYNWLFLENLDSIGRPCFDTTETFIFNRNLVENNSGKTIDQNRTETGDCPGAQFFPELADLCKDFADPCEAVKDILFKDDNLFSFIGRKIFDKFTGMLGPAGSDGFCAVNSASIGCKKLCELTAVDPNVKYGPGDNNSLKHVNFLHNYGYTIFFENLASATAPAAYVEVTDTLDKTKLDLSTFQAGVFGWGDSIVIPDANRGDFSLLKDLRPLHPNKLRIDIRVDTATGIVKWKFFTVDTATLQLTEDPAQGFLPPNTDGKQGVGFVSFSINPKAGVTSGAIINNNASIVFDNNAAMVTHVWQHIVDTTRPQSQVVPLPPTVYTPNFVVNWGGSDAHSGIDKFAVYVSVNDSLFKQWKKFTTAVSDTFHGQFNKTYKFFSVALDKAGNYEDAPVNPDTSPDAVTTPQVALPVSLFSFTATKSADGKEADLRWLTATELNLSHFEIQRSADGINYSTIGRVNALNMTNGASYFWQDIAPLPKVNYYRLKMIDNDATFKISPVRTVRVADKNEILVYPTVTSDLVFIQSEKQVTLQLINLMGVVLQSKVVKGSATFDLSKLPSAVYIIRADEEKQSFKVIKQ